MDLKNRMGVRTGLDWLRLWIDVGLR
jgi:hypothetical protein